MRAAWKTSKFHKVSLPNVGRRYMAGILSIRGKTQNNQSIYMCRVSVKLGDTRLLHIQLLTSESLENSRKYTHMSIVKINYFMYNEYMK